MIIYKRDVLERQSLSEVKMGRGSPICERVHKKIVEYFKNNVPQRQIAKALQISSSTVHNIIKKFRETAEISVRKGQGQRPLLDAHGLRALRWHCITLHDSVIDITKWAQEYGDPYSEFVLCIYPIQSAHTQQWTHTHHEHTPGSSWGFGALLKGTSVVVLKVERALYIQNWQSDVTYGQVWWPILGICALQLTHPKCTHTAVNTHTVNTHPEQWSAIYAAAPGEQLGVRCLAQGIEGGESAVHSLPSPTIPAGPKLEPTTFRLRVRLSNH